MCFREEAVQIMLKFIVVLAVFVVACRGDDTTSTTTAAPRVYCAHAPNNLYTCLRSPKLINWLALSKCKPDTDECTLMNCIFRESNWLTEGAINKDKLKEFFNQLAAENPAWSAAVEHLKTVCLVDALPVQGVHLNCPAFDVMHCIQFSFLRMAPPSQWLTKPECESTRTYATHCPLCPDDCFAPVVPYGSCNACLVLPRSP